MCFWSVSTLFDQWGSLKPLLSIHSMDNNGLFKGQPYESRISGHNFLWHRQGYYGEMVILSLCKGLIAIIMQYTTKRCQNISLWYSILFFHPFFHPFFLWYWSSDTKNLSQFSIIIITYYIIHAFNLLFYNRWLFKFLIKFHFNLFEYKKFNLSINVLNCYANKQTI